MATINNIITSVTGVFLLAAATTFAVDVQSVTGTWQNAKDADGHTPDNFSTSSGGSKINWGNATSGNNNSGYVFSSLAPILNVALDTPFAFGTFSHLNFPITGDTLASVDLKVVESLLINGVTQNFSSTYTFLHDETPNNRTQSNPNCCPDIVTFQNNISTLGSFLINGQTYTIGLVGFATSPGGPLLQQFVTTEGQSNSATLYAQISKPEVFVPEPSTYVILATMLGAGAYIAHRRKVSRA